MSAEDAINNYSKRALGQGKRTSKGKNKKPERNTQHDCMDWFEQGGFSMHVVEAKAVWSKAAGRYLTGQVAPGFSDTAGCTADGIGCFVEFKAKGKRSAVSLAQREFLKAKILRGCFSAVVDSAECLQEYYTGWIKAKKNSIDAGIAYLLSKLPKDKTQGSGRPLF